MVPVDTVEVPNDLIHLCLSILSHTKTSLWCIVAHLL